LILGFDPIDDSGAFIALRGTGIRRPAQPGIAPGSIGRFRLRHISP
jgi:hypothetical protein